MPRDIGFRTLKVDSSNLSDVHRIPDETPQSLLDELESSVKPGRTGEDLLFGALLAWGLMLDLPIAQERVSGHEVFMVDDGALVACFDEELDMDLMRHMARRSPLRAVFRDSGFAGDSDRINAEQNFRELSPATDIKVI